MTTINSTYTSACVSGFQQSIAQSLMQITLRGRWQKIGLFDGIYSAINGVGHCIAEMGKHSQGIESSSFMSTGIDLGVDLATHPLTTLLHNKFLIAAEAPLKLQISTKISEIKKTFTDLEAKPSTLPSFLADKRNQIEGHIFENTGNERQQVSKYYYQIQPFVKQLSDEATPFDRPEYTDALNPLRNNIRAVSCKSDGWVTSVKVTHGTKNWYDIDVVHPDSVPKFKNHLSGLHTRVGNDAAYWEGIKTQFATHQIPIENRFSTYTRIFDLLSKQDVNTQSQKTALDAIFKSPQPVPPSTFNSWVIDVISSASTGTSMDASPYNIPAGNISAPFDAGQAICTPDQQSAVNTSNATHELLPDFSNECNTSQQLTAEPNPWKAPATIMASALIVSGVWLACLAAIQLATNQELNDKERKKRTLQVVGGCGLACTGIGAFYAAI